AISTRETPEKTPTPIMTPSTIATITTSGDAPIPPTTFQSIILENLPTFNSAFRFDERLRSLETTFSEYRQTNPFVDAVSAIPSIVHQYMTQQMTEAVREAVQIQTNRLQDSLQRENDEFLRNIDENIKKIIKGQVKNQVKEQISRILPRIEDSVNATLKAEVLTRSSQSSRTSYAIAADLSEMELKKILIEKMEGNKSIQRSDEQRNLYKALVEAYDADKAILDTYGESTILKRRREDDDQEGPSAGSDRRSKRQKEGGEHASASTPSETATGGAGRSTTGSQSRQLSASESAFAEELVQTTCQMEEPPHPVFETGADDQPIVQTSQHPEWFSQPKRPPLPDPDLSEMELKKILIDKMEGNKSIQQSDEQQNLYKALVEAYDADKTILDTYGESAILKRRREDDDQEGPSAGSDQGSKRRREGEEHASASTLSEPATGSTCKSTIGTQSRQMSASESAFAEEPVQTTCQLEEPSHSVFETGAEDQPIVQTSQHPEWFSQP
nr:hypothetical protein [Tanacetum cinerariifolium]